MKVHLLYGKNGLEVDLPKEAEVTVIRKQDMPLAAPDAFETAYDRPRGSAGLEELAGPGRKVCVLICDVTRPVPNGRALPPLLNRLLGAGVAAEDVVVLVATGLHRPNLGEELAAVVGDQWVLDNFKVENHYAPRDEEHLDLGPTSDGVPVKLDARFVAADLKIAIGLVEPHFMAGWSGGRKLISPGVCHEETIRTLHSFPFMDHPKAANCNLAGNPLHRAQMEIMAKVGPVLAVNCVLDDERRLSFVNFGEAEASHLEAVAFVERYARVELPRQFESILTTAAGWPLDQNYYQAIKGAVGAVELLAPGGRMFLAAHCGEGLGSADFVESQGRLAALGPAAFKESLRRKPMAAVDEWLSQMLLRVLEKGRLTLYSEGLADERRQYLCADLSRNLARDLAAWLATRADKRLAVIPEGPYVVPFARQAGGL